VVPQHAADETGSALDLLLAAPLLVALLLYWLAVVVGRRPWPRSRTVLWSAGVLACLVATVGPLAERSGTSFPAHAVAHVLLGMLGPLLLVLAAPVTLALRTLPTPTARGLVRLLLSAPVRFLVHPVVTGVLNVGGLWLLYTSGLYARAHGEPWLHGLVHVHVLLSGYLFTAAVIGVDPNRHRRSLGYRATVLVLFMAAHSVLAKYLYAHPPAGVPAAQAELGSMIMYYAADLVDLVVVVVLCHRWYAASRPRTALVEQPA